MEVKPSEWHVFVKFLCFSQQYTKKRKNWLVLNNTIHLIINNYILVHETSSLKIVLSSCHIGLVRENIVRQRETVSVSNSQ